MVLSNADKIEIRDMILTFMQNNKNKIRQFFLEDEAAENAANAAAQQGAWDVEMLWFTKTILSTLFNPPTTRDEALKNYKDIEVLRDAESQGLRRNILSNRLKEANEKFKERKRNG